MSSFSAPRFCTSASALMMWMTSGDGGDCMRTLCPLRDTRVSDYGSDGTGSGTAT